MTHNELLAVLQSNPLPTGGDVAQALEDRVDSILTENHMPSCCDSNVLALMQALGEVLAPLLGGQTAASSGRELLSFLLSESERLDLIAALDGAVDSAASSAPRAVGRWRALRNRLAGHKTF